MKTKTGKGIVTLAIISAIIGIVQIVKGQTDHNSIMFGLANSYLYFVIGFILLGMSKIIDLLHDISNKINK